ncbi:hypothetical protein HDU99_003968, partial [Rhizoclosmatium hyalinum]
MRAKSIKNKAKINAELSPTELKNLLKKAKLDMQQLQIYINSLENEVKIWRSGSSVPKVDWVQPINVAALVGDSATTSPSASNGNLPASAVPAHMKDLIDGRSSTPVPPISQDERDAFLQRENELGDQLTEAQAALKSAQAKVETLEEELSFLKSRDGDIESENKTLSGTLNELKLELEKVSCENKESVITIESLKDANGELLKEVDTLKKQIVDIQSTAAATPAEDPIALKNAAEEKELRKMDRLQQMMTEMDPSHFMTEKEKQLRETIVKLAHMKENLQPPSSPEEIASQHVELIEAKTQIAKQDLTINELSSTINAIQDEANTFKKKKEEHEKKIAALEAEYQELLDKTIHDEEVQGGPQLSKTIQDIKARLEAQFNSKRETQMREIQELREIVAKREADIAQLQSTLSSTQQANEEMKTTLAAVQRNDGEVIQKDEEIEKMRKSMATQLGEFDAMKKKLMRDLQNRCEKVVELEISLDETRDQYNNILKNSNSRAQQQKMAFLERNLEQLTNVQRQLVEQNSTLKKEFSVAERKMAA